MSCAALVAPLTLGLLVAGCHAPPATGPHPLRYLAPFTCELDFRDVACIECLKARCCAPATACNARTGQCPCAIRCIGDDNTKACAAACASTEEKAMATCSAEACAAECPGTGGRR